MIRLSRQHLNQIFLTLGYSPLDYLYIDEINKSLNQLNKQQFDIQTFQQLQNQCTTNSKGQIKLQDLIMTFIKAQNILIQRNMQINKMIKQLHDQLTEKMRDPTKNQAIIQQLQEELYEAKQQQVSNTINLQIIRKPFTKVQSPRTPRTPKSAAKMQQKLLSPYAGQRQSSPSQQFATMSLPGEGLLNIANTHTFTWIFQLSCLLLVISLPCMFYIPCYVNIILLLLIALNMISGYFCRYILRVWMYLVILTVVIDIVWYIVTAKSIWLGTKNYPNYVNSYIRLTLVLNIVVDIGKLVLFVLLASEYNVDQSQKKVVSVFGLLQVQLSHDQQQKNYFKVLNKGGNHGGLDDDQF